MSHIYGIEPDLCIQNPRLILDFGKDIFLPQYFHSQLQYLKKTNYNKATKAANKITQSLHSIDNLEKNLLAFKTPQNGLLYFINQEIDLVDLQFTENQLDIRHPLNRYLLVLFKISNLLEASVTFLINSSSLLEKCNLLNFNIANINDFCNYSESSLNIEVILSIQRYLEPGNSTPKIQWSEESNVVSKSIKHIYWQDF